ncbi:hypothetical protein [Vibrio mexicanus]|uniref:hypothetical protein n=1 Tax=Vibrio mexicanus TaxID=1004326 RepID=UPI003B511487
MLALYRVMKEHGTHEGCIEQMYRLFSQKLCAGHKVVPVDAERLIRIDDLELDPKTQDQVSEVLAQLNEHNFKELGDYAGFKQEFLQLNGFGFENVNYSADVDVVSIYQSSED